MFCVEFSYILFFHSTDDARPSTNQLTAKMLPVLSSSSVRNTRSLVTLATSPLTTTDYPTSKSPSIKFFSSVKPESELSLNNATALIATPTEISVTELTTSTETSRKKIIQCFKHDRQ